MPTRFEFGENWKSFLLNFDENHIEEAISDIQSIYGVESLEGCRFLDIGCGSGIFSLAAYRLGAEEVVSFDYDADAVTCCKELRHRENADNWTVLEGDILDMDFLDSLGQFDYVYCWGVVHHTGDMWTAIDNATITLDQNGELCVGIYNEVNKDESPYNSYTALQIKKLYNRLPGVFQRLMVYGYAASHLGIRTLLKKESPWAYLDRYPAENRGMDYWHDVRDWLGGLPFEFAAPEEVRDHFRENHPELEHKKTNIRGSRPGTVNVYLYKK